MQYLIAATLEERQEEKKKSDGWMDKYHHYKNGQLVWMKENVGLLFEKLIIQTFN